jgi:lysophospholipase L1-like esterase
MQAIMRSDDHHREKHQSILAMIKSRPIRTVFFGDSLVRRWEEHPTLWQRFFAPFEPANFGVGADRLEHMKWRLLNGELEGIDAETVLFLGGTNNLEDQESTAIASGITELVSIIAEKLPQARIILLGLLPRNRNSSGRSYRQQIRSVNQALATWAAANQIVFADLTDLLSSDGESLDPQLSDDGLHLNGRGYERIGPPLARLIGR